MTEMICRPFRVGIDDLLAARLGRHPQVGRVALLSALVKAFNHCHHRAPDESPALKFYTGRVFERIPFRGKARGTVFFLSAFIVRFCPSLGSFFIQSILGNALGAA